MACRNQMKPKLPSEFVVNLTVSWFAAAIATLGNHSDPGDEDTFMQFVGVMSGYRIGVLLASTYKAGGN